MVGQAEPIKPISEFFAKPGDIGRLGLRKIVVLTSGLVDSALTIEEFHTLAKNLSSRIGARYTFGIPSLSNFRKLLKKLCEKGIFTNGYSLARKLYGYRLTSMGEGEYDGILMSLSKDNYADVFKDFQYLADLAI